MDQSSTIQNSSLSVKLAIGFGIVGILFIGLIIFFCCRRRGLRDHHRHRSIESFQQLYFSKTPSNQINNLNTPIIERWSTIERPSLTFYRVYIQDDPDELYRPVTEERARSAIEQSKAMEYCGHEIIFF